MIEFTNEVIAKIDEHFDDGVVVRGTAKLKENQVISATLMVKDSLVVNDTLIEVWWENDDYQIHVPAASLKFASRIMSHIFLVLESVCGEATVAQWQK